VVLEGIVLLDLISLVDRCFRPGMSDMSGFGGSNARSSRSTLAIPDSGIQIVKDTTLMRLAMKPRIPLSSVAGKSKLFWTQEGRPAGRKRNFHESLPLLFSSTLSLAAGTHTHHTLRERHSKAREENISKRGLACRAGGVCGNELLGVVAVSHGQGILRVRSDVLPRAVMGVVV